MTARERDHERADRLFADLAAFKSAYAATIADPPELRYFDPLLEKGYGDEVEDEDYEIEISIGEARLGHGDGPRANIYLDGSGTYCNIYKYAGEQWQAGAEEPEVTRIPPDLIDFIEANKKELSV